jgi:hypothetical protein
MMSRRETVKAAVHFEDPPYVPLLYFNKDKEDSDIINVEVIKHFEGIREDFSEWGFQWERYDDTMGQPREALLADWSAFVGFHPPDSARSDRFEDLDKARKDFGEDRYYVASLALSGFTVMCFLRGFTGLLEDIYLSPERTRRLGKMVFGFEEEVIEASAEKGFDAVAFFDDWGMQDSIIISPEAWREIFKPLYQRQFDLCHRLGLDVYFHSCGYYYPIIGDLIEAGVDILNISQPNLYDIEVMGRDFAGQVCFMCPVSYQTTGISGTKEEIYRDVREMLENLATPKGGFIGYVEEYGSIGMSDENYRHCIQAFRELGGR